MHQQSFIDTTWHTNMFVEFVKYVVILLGANLACFSLIRFLNHERFYSAMSMGGFGIATALQEAALLGDPWSPWRLPLLLVANACGLRYMYFSMREIEHGPKDSPRRREQ